MSWELVLLIGIALVLTAIVGATAISILYGLYWVFLQLKKVWDDLSDEP